VGTDILTQSAMGKPCKPYCKIIAYGIAKCASRMMSLNDIYAFFAQHFAGFKTSDATTGWKNTIRHNLSHQKYFVKSSVSSPEPGKGVMWMFDPVAAVQDGFVVDLTPEEQRDLAEQNRLYCGTSRVVRKTKSSSSELTFVESPVSPVSPVVYSPALSPVQAPVLQKTEDQIVEHFMNQFIKPEPVDVHPVDQLDDLVVTTQAPPTNCPDDYFSQYLMDMDDTPIFKESPVLKQDALYREECKSAADPLKPYIASRPTLLSKVGYGSVAPTTGKTYYIPSNLVSQPTPVTVSSVAPIPAHITSFDILQMLNPGIAQQFDLLTLRQQHHLSEVGLLEQLLQSSIPSLPLIHSPETQTVAPFQLHVSTSITASPILMSPNLSTPDSLKRKRRASG
jgi:hypothetical protein